jgi:hypothetical protein
LVRRSPVARSITACISRRPMPCRWCDDDVHLVDIEASVLRLGRDETHQPGRCIFGRPTAALRSGTEPSTPLGEPHARSTKPEAQDRSEGLRLDGQGASRRDRPVWAALAFQRKREAFLKTMTSRLRLGGRAARQVMAVAAGGPDRPVGARATSKPRRAPRQGRPARGATAQERSHRTPNVRLRAVPTRPGRAI